MCQLSPPQMDKKNVSASQFGILVNLVLCCLIGCSTWLIIIIIIIIMHAAAKLPFLVVLYTSNFLTENADRL